MDNLEHKESDEVYHSRLETLVKLIARQSALLEKIKPDFLKYYSIEKISKMAAVAHDNKEKIEEVEDHYKKQKSELDCILKNNPQFLIDCENKVIYDDIKKAEVMYSEFKL